MRTREHDGSTLRGAALTITTLLYFETLNDALNQMVPTKTVLSNLEVTEKLNEHYETWKDFYQSSNQWEL